MFITLETLLKKSLSLPSGFPAAQRVKSPPALQARLAQAVEQESFSGSSNTTLERHAANESQTWVAGSMAVALHP